MFVLKRTKNNNHENATENPSDYVFVQIGNIKVSPLLGNISSYDDHDSIFRKEKKKYFLLD